MRKDTGKKSSPAQQPTHYSQLVDNAMTIADCVQSKHQQRIQISPQLLLLLLLEIVTKMLLTHTHSSELFSTSRNSPIVYISMVFPPPYYSTKSSLTNCNITTSLPKNFVTILDAPFMISACIKCMSLKVEKEDY